MSITSVEELLESLREKTDSDGITKIPFSMLESCLRLAYSCGRVDALVDSRNELAYIHNKVAK